MAGGLAGDARRQGRRLRARDGPGRPDARGGRRRRRSASRRSTRPSSSARPGITAPVLVLYPIPPPRRRSRSGSAWPSRPAAGPRWRRCWRRPTAAGVVGDLVDRARGRDRARARRRRRPRTWSRVARRILDAGATLSGVWTHLQEAEVGRDHGRAGPPLRGRARLAPGGGRSPCRDVISPRAPRSCSATCRATTPSGPG